MITFTDGYKLMQDDVDKAVSATVEAMMNVLPKEAQRFDVVEALLQAAKENIKKMPIQFLTDKK